MNIGYVGLGNMGGALARRLQLTYSLTVYDRDAACVQRLAEHGANRAESLGQIAASCDVILLCLPTSEHVRSVLLGPDGIAAIAKPGTLVVDQTSGDPTVTRDIAAKLAERGIDMVDAPVSGGPAGADAGTIAIMVGAAPALFERIGHVLRAISPNVFHAGDIGCGHVVKLANNLLSAGTRLMTLEAMALAVKNGVEGEKALDIMMTSGGRNFWMEKYMASHILTGKLKAAFALGLLHKDVRLACQLGQDSGMPMLFGNLAKDFYQMALNEYSFESPVNVVALTMDRITGSHVVPDGHTID
ncbi:3-hydroxyisobutyrate dehydrogenase [Variovorax sp. YR266]|uniref:NAD(P)-dependent oxidoreductase n=1 Tax=Variovorax sp. YR266 TaxID=1884386 RepID=UPI00089B3AFF|nr:3-hydroxyisobutyrate dehydrogenase [Variovorax sp. YR266]